MRIVTVWAIPKVAGRLGTFRVSVLAIFYAEIPLKIIKVLNNNIAIASDECGQDVIVMGCGVAFQKSYGDDVDDAKIERIFRQNVEGLSRRFVELAAQIPEDYFEITQSIVANAKISLGHDLDDSIYLTLADHIAFAIDRLKNGIVVHNALLLETKLIYPDEFQAASSAVDYLNERFSMSLPEDEAAFIALHFVNAGSSGNMDETLETTRMVREITTIIRNYFHLEFDRDSLAYRRLLVHLKFFAGRIIGTDGTDEFEDLQMLQLVKAQYQDSYRCVERISGYVARRYKREVSENERMYLTLHIQRLRDTHKNQGA